MRNHLRRFATLALSAGLASCTGDAAGRGNTIAVVIGQDAGTLFPTDVRFSQEREISALLFERLAERGPGASTMGDAGWRPRLATSWEWRPDSSAVTFHLDPRARWHDGKGVTAADVRFGFDAYTKPARPGADGQRMRANVDSLTVGDSATVTVWFGTRSPERFYYVVEYLTPLPEHLLRAVPVDSLSTSSFAKRPVGNGPYRLGEWLDKQRIELLAVSDFHRGKPRNDRVVWLVIPDATVQTQQLYSGNADFIERISSNDLVTLAAHADMKAVPLVADAYYAIYFNLHDAASERPHPVFGDRATRRALTMAIDRLAIARNLFDSLGRVARGPFSSAQWSADSTLTQLPYDVDAARRLLDSAGWRLGPDSVRTRRGVPLAFSILAAGSSSVAARVAPILLSQWKAVGARVTVETIDPSLMQARATEHKFDLFVRPMQTDPSPTGVRQSWSTGAMKLANGLNYVRYSNPDVDRELDAAVAAQTVAEGRAHFSKAYQLLLDDAAAIWFAEPQIVGMVSTRIVTDSLWPGAWWLSVPYWHAR